MHLIYSHMGPQIFWLTVTLKKTILECTRVKDVTWKIPNHVRESNMPVNPPHLQHQDYKHSLTKFTCISCSKFLISYLFSVCLIWVSIYCTTLHVSVPLSMPVFSYSISSCLSALVDCIPTILCCQSLIQTHLLAAVDGALLRHEYFKLP